MATRKKRAPKSKSRIRRGRPAAARPEASSRRAVLTSFSTDWYWEQDAQLRFTLINVQTGKPAEKELGNAFLGKRRWETGYEVEGGWDAHRELLKARAPFRDVLMWCDGEDGGRTFINVSGEPVFDPKGRFTGYRGLGRDVTRQKRGEQLLRLQHQVTRHVAEAASAVDGAESALRAICGSEGWDSAEFWSVDGAGGAMRRFVYCVMPGLAAAQAFVDASSDMEFQPGEGLVGAVWHTGEPLWIPDLTQDARTRRKSLSQQTGLRAALLCPVPSGGRIVGVLSFACRKIRPPDEPLLQALMAMATQLGLFMRRAEAEARLRESEERFRRTFELAGSGVAHLSLERHFLRVNRKLCEIFGYSESELIGRSVMQLSHPDDLNVAHMQRDQMYAGEIDSIRIEKRYLRKDGSIVWAAVSVALERDRSGKPQYEITVYDDISARKAAEDALRDSEGRFRSLTDLSSDWFWESDADYRFTRLEGRNVAGGDEALRQRLMGNERWNTGLEVEGGWEAHRALLDARKPFVDTLMWRTMAGGSVRYVSVSGEPVFTAEGSFTGYRGVGRDITEEKRAEQLLRVEHHVSSALSEARSAEDGVNAVMRLVCEAEGWSCGRYFEVGAGGDEVIYRQGWSLPGAGAAFTGFLEGSHGMRFRRGQGLVGLAWQDGKPIWSTDTGRDPRVMAQGLTGGASRGAFVFGVMAESETFGLLSFTSQAVRKPDERLLQAALVIGSQVGQFLRRMQAEASLRESESRFRSLTEMSSDFFWETDTQHRFLDLVHGPSYAKKMGRTVGKTAWELPYTHPDAAGWAALRAAMDAQQAFRDFEFGRPLQDGTTRYYSVNGDPHFAPDGRFMGYRGVGRDITDIALARERIASLAYQDALTGLANRTSLAPALEQAIERTRRRSTKLAGVFLDLDGFKQINDVHGHDTGDRLLVETARRLKASLRSSDPVARLGGDEFFVVLEDLNDNAPAERVANKLLAALRHPYDLGGGKEATISASIGISLFPDDAGDAVTLMKHADTAMYEAKQAGKNGYCFFSGKA
jgi:diguanylate cyclase (GGDEF)-like protein/PAS domain S-box-containing protein